MNKTIVYWRVLAAGFGLVLSLACGSREAPDLSEGEGAVMDRTESVGKTVPGIQALNAFYYYRALEAAWDFYTRILGFRTVADYGFAKMLQVGPTSFLTLVDEAEGMHDAAEPKSVTLAVVTEEVEEWWEYLTGQGVEMRASLGEVDPGRPHNGFVAVDPEGYFLEFERFNPHPENQKLLPVLAEVEALYPDGGETAPGVSSPRTDGLGVQGTVLWLYYEDLGAIQDFYREALEVDILVDQGWAKVFPASTTGFLGFVDGSRGLHTATAEKAVTVSFLTSDLQGWWNHLEGVAGFRFRSAEPSPEGDFVLTFVGYDPEGYFLEWDDFLPVADNEGLLSAIR